MKAMTVKDFGSLEHRDFENPVVRDSIRIALKEREQQKHTVTQEWIENLVSDLNASYLGIGEKPGYQVLGDALYCLGVTVEK